VVDGGAEEALIRRVRDDGHRFPFGNRRPSVVTGPLVRREHRRIRTIRGPCVSKGSPVPMIFVDLPVTDLPRATAFYEAVGCVVNPAFTDRSSACLVPRGGGRPERLTGRRYRSIRRKARMSSASSPGSSCGAKWPPRGMVVYRTTS
jgi:hypothetical protein